MHPMSSSRTVLQAKLSALTAATSAAVVFAVGIAVISVRAILDRAFQGSWRINWVLSVAVPHDALERAAALGQLVIRLEVDPELAGGLAIYGRRFGRYPFDPTVIFLLRR